MPGSACWHLENPTCLDGDDPSPAWRPELGSVGADGTGWKAKSMQPSCAFRHRVVLGPSPRAVSQDARSAVTCRTGSATPRLETLHVLRDPTLA